MKLRILVLIVIGLFASAPLRAQEGLTTFDPALDAQMAALEHNTQTLRGLPALNEVGRAFPTRDEVRAYITKQYREQLTPELARRALAFYVALGMLQPNTDLPRLFVEAYSSQVAGFYDTETGIMNVIPVIGDDPGGQLSLSERAIYIHEYTHALQDQHFDLDAIISTDETGDHPDRLLAGLSLVEGDATLSMSLYMQQVVAENPMAGLSILVEGLRAGNLLPPSGIPAPLLRELLFPYEVGLNFVIALYTAGGWDTVNDAYENRPITSEQIMHPEKYLDGEVGLPVTLSDVRSALSDDWSLVWDTSLGEYYLGEHLRMQLARAAALRAAQGWGGDHFQVYVDAEERVVWLLKLVWDTPQDAAEFATAYAEFGETWAEGVGSRESTATGTCYIASTAICVSSDSSVIASAPDVDLARELLRAQTG